MLAPHRSGHRRHLGLEEAVAKRRGRVVAAVSARGELRCRPRESGDPCRNNNDVWFWVPVFAGTTAECYRAARNDAGQPARYHAA